MKPVSFFKPDWPAPPNISSYCSMRAGGVSRAPYESMNIGSHVGDARKCVDENRQEIRRLTKMPGEPRWLEQVHGKKVVKIGGSENPGIIQADGAYTIAKRQVLAVMTADCLPVLLASENGQEIAVVHAGWKGLAANVIGEACAKFKRNNQLLAWMGPAIGSCHYEVDEQVRSRFSMRQLDCFRVGKDSEHWWLDIYALAKIQLLDAGVSQVYGGGFCTYHEKDRFFSYRREGVTGRFGVFIWMN